MQCGCKKILIAVCAAILLPPALLYFIGIRINLSDSVPPGIYIAGNGPVEKGVYVHVCPPDTPAFRLAKERGYIPSGLCPGNFSPLVKRVIASGGDRISVTPAGIRINGISVMNSRVLDRDPAGRKMPVSVPEYILRSDEIFLHGHWSRYSFDSRYTGPVSVNHVWSVLHPVLVRKGR